MLIDKILSRFKIKTKVLIFVLPFVVSISAVGLTGLYASGMPSAAMPTTVTSTCGHSGRASG